MKSRGFTLVELVMVIMISGIMAASTVLFFKPAVEGYLDARRRAGLSDGADTALRRMARDVRRAVPNSVRVPSSACLEVVPSKSGGIYRKALDKDYPAASDDLDLSGKDGSFDVLSSLSKVPAAGDYVVIGNQNTDDVYLAASPVRGTVDKWETPPPGVGGANVGVGRLSLSTPTQFPLAYDGGRFFIVDKNEASVLYICRGADGSGNGELVRLVRGLTPAAGCPGSGGVRLASHVATCSFTRYSNLGEDYVWLYLELLEAGERVALSYGVQVSNVP